MDHGRLRETVYMAERVGFEPTVPLPAHVLSRHADSATLAPLHIAGITAKFVILAWGLRSNKTTRWGFKPLTGVVEIVVVVGTTPSALYRDGRETASSVPPRQASDKEPGLRPSTRRARDIGTTDSIRQRAIPIIEKSPTRSAGRFGSTSKRRRTAQKARRPRQGAKTIQSNFPGQIRNCL